MRAAGILILALAGLTAYWVITGKGKGSTTTQEIISSPLNALGEPAGQGTQTLSSTGLTPPSFGFTPPAPAPPSVTGLFNPPPPSLPGLTGILNGAGQSNSGATALDPTQALLQG